MVLLLMITVTQINDLRKETQVSMLLCKQALEATGGDFDAAKKWLREQGKEVTGDSSVFGYTLIENATVSNQGSDNKFIYSNGHTSIDIRSFGGSSPYTVWGDTKSQLVLNPVKV